jgi:hypothetical protein
MVKAYVCNTPLCLADGNTAKVQMTNIIKKLRMCLPNIGWGTLWIDVQVKIVLHECVFAQLTIGPDAHWSGDVLANIQFLKDLAATWIAFGAFVSEICK